MSTNTLTEQLVEFGPVKKELKKTLQQLQAAQQTEEVRNAIAALQRSISDLTDVCGKSATPMVLPITPR